MKLALLLVVGAVSVVACSSSDSSGSSTNASCSCSVEDNGVAQTLACATTACVNGVSYTCSSSANVTQGEECTVTTSDAGTPKDSGTNTTPGATTVACPDDLQDTLTCPTATQYCASARSTRSTGGVVTDGQCLDKPTGCNDCDCATSDAATAFTKVGGGCRGGATVVCENKNGAIAILCEK